MAERVGNYGFVAENNENLLVDTAALTAMLYVRLNASPCDAMQMESRRDTRRTKSSSGKDTRNRTKAGSGKYFNELHSVSNGSS